MAKKITLEQLDQKFDLRFNHLDERHDELMDFLKEHMVVRADLANFMTKDDGRRLEHRMLVLEDQQAKMQETMELELVAPTRRMDCLERRVAIVEGKLGLA